MGIDMYLEQSQTQSGHVITMCQAQLEAYQTLQTAIQTFAQDTESLQGDAYNSARDFFSSVLLPLAQGGQLYAETLSKAIAKLPADYQDRVDTKSWREDDLLDKIRQEEIMIAHLDEINQSISKLKASSERKAQLRRNNTELMRGHHANKRVYETILEDLRAYDPYSATLFDDLDNIASQLAMGLSQVKGSWNAAEGVFNTPSNLSWVTYLSAYQVTKELTVSKADKAFITSLMAEYGFDVETAKQLLTIKQGIDSQFSYFAGYTSQECDYLFLRLIGAVSYDGVKWDETAGYLTPYFSEDLISNPTTGETQKKVKSLLTIFQTLGLSEQEAKQLTYNLRLQHALANGGNTIKQMRNIDFNEGSNTYKNAKAKYKNAYGTTKGFDEFWDERLKAYSNNGAGNADFTHQSITMATHLNSASFQLSDLYGGREQVKDLSGWEGDTTYNASDMKPSIGEDDYKADLDAVNIIGRMDKGASYSQAMASYYNDVTQGSSVREKEFLKNEDWTEVKGTIYASLVPDEVLTQGDKASKAYVSENYKGVSQFLERLERVAGE